MYSLTVVPRFPPGLCAFLYGLQFIVGNSAVGMYLPSELTGDMAETPLPTDQHESSNGSNGQIMADENSFEEALGPTELIFKQVPNEGDVQIMDAVNMAIYLSIYKGTEKERLERWESMWEDYEAKDRGISHRDSLPPSHLCPGPRDFPSLDEAVGSFKESVLDQEELLYLSDFSVPPFIYMSRAAPRGQLRIGDVRFLPGRGVEAHGILSDLVEKIISPTLAAAYKVSNLKANWSFRNPSCDFRIAADALYSDRGTMYVGLATPSHYISKYFNVSCPVMMYGMMSLISGYIRGPREGGVASWNKPGISIGTVAYLPYGKPVADNLPKARIRVYSTLSYLLGAVYSRDVHGFLLPSDTARAVLASGEFCVDVEGGCKIIGNIGRNDKPIVFLFRKYPLEDPYVNTYLDETYSPASVDCQQIFHP